MTILYPQLKNFIQNDPLSDWFELSNQKHSCYQKQNESTFELDLKKKNLNIKKIFFLF